MDSGDSGAWFVVYRRVRIVRGTVKVGDREVSVLLGLNITSPDSGYVLPVGLSGYLGSSIPCDKLQPLPRPLHVVVGS